jgi:hypothetical protein
MRIKEVNGKRMIEKKFLRFACDVDCDFTHTIVTKQDLLGTFRDYFENLNDPRCAESIADDSWQVGLKKFNQMTREHYVQFLDSSTDEITPKMVKEAEFVLYYNPYEFQAWVGSAETLKQYGGEFSIEKKWSEL